MAGSHPNGRTDNQLSTWEKVRLGAQHKWEKDDLKLVLHWFRQIVALFFGLTWGLIAFKGFNAFASHLVVNLVATVVFYSSVLGVDAEEFGGHTTLAQESLAPAISMFLLSWIISYSLMHF